MTPIKRTEIMGLLDNTRLSSTGILLFIFLQFLNTFYIIIQFFLLGVVWFSPYINLWENILELKPSNHTFFLSLFAGFILSNYLLFVFFLGRISKFLDRRYFILNLRELTEDCYNLSLDSNGDLEVAEILFLLEDIKVKIDDLFKLLKYKVFLVEESRVYVKKASSELLLSFINVLENLHKQLLTEVTEQIQDLETSKRQLSDLRSDTISLDSVKQLQLTRIEQKLEEFKEFSHKLEIQL